MAAVEKHLLAMPPLLGCGMAGASAEMSNMPWQNLGYVSNVCELLNLFEELQQQSKRNVAGVSKGSACDTAGATDKNRLSMSRKARTACLGIYEISLTLFAVFKKSK